MRHVSCPGLKVKLCPDSGAWMDLLNYTCMCMCMYMYLTRPREYRTSVLPEECDCERDRLCRVSARAGARAVGRPSPLRATRSRRRPGTPASQHLFVVGHRHRRGEHAIRAARDRLPLLGGRRARVGQRDHVEALFVGGAHGRLDAAGGEEPGQHNRLDAVRLELRLEVSAREGVEALFVLDDDVARLRLHGRVEVGVPAPLGEELVAGASREDAEPCPQTSVMKINSTAEEETTAFGAALGGMLRHGTVIKKRGREDGGGWCVRDRPVHSQRREETPLAGGAGCAAKASLVRVVARVLLEADRRVEDLCAGPPRLARECRALFEHACLVHAFLDGAVELAALRREFVLVLNEDDCGLLGVHGGAALGLGGRECAISGHDCGRAASGHDRLLDDERGDGG
mmetsp:Transcript_37632/g.121663  ORF Transcript_37632/g.121663 Transcript_37632/m.121663 type:complete len:400 (-) Transcript_37632:53-1252(-)